MSSAYDWDMEQELRRPDYVPRKHDRTSSMLNNFLSAAGMTAMMLCLLGSAAAISAWAIAKLFGFEGTILYVLVALFELPVLWITIWTAGRAWHLEKRLASGKDMDQPVFKLFHYFTKSS
jgi:hypothetical protein